ncbi:MAG: MMPL family transporter [Ilumatobacteraceae bacterium]
MSTFLYRLGKFSVRNRRLVLIGWLLAFVAIAVGSVAAGGETSDEFSIPGTESQQAFDLLDERFPAQSGTSAQIVFATQDGSPLVESQDAVADTLAEAAELDGVIFVSDPFTSGTVSQDGTIGYATVRYDLKTPEVGIEGVEHLVETGAIAESQGVQVEFGGEVVTGNPEQHPPTSEIIGLAVAVVVLLFAFGSVLAMGLPLVTAILGLGIGLTGITLMSAFMDLSSTAPTLATMIGLAVGIDYALFIVTRHRQGLSEGLSVEEAAAAQRNRWPAPSCSPAYGRHRDLGPRRRRHPVHRDGLATGRGRHDRRARRRLAPAGAARLLRHQDRPLEGAVHQDPHERGRPRHLGARWAPVTRPPGLQGWVGRPRAHAVARRADARHAARDASTPAPPRRRPPSVRRTTRSPRASAPGSTVPDRRRRRGRLGRSADRRRHLLERRSPRPTASSP